MELHIYHNMYIPVYQFMWDSNHLSFLIQVFPPCSVWALSFLRFLGVTLTLSLYLHKFKIHPLGPKSRRAIHLSPGCFHKSVISPETDLLFWSPFERLQYQYSHLDSSRPYQHMRRRFIYPGSYSLPSLSWPNTSLEVWLTSEVAQSCPTLCDLTDYSPPGSSIHGIF